MTTSVWLIYERCYGDDRLTSIWATEALADIECDRLNESRPNSDGFYYECYEVQGGAQ